MARLARCIGVGGVLLPVVARAQDATVLVALLAPPMLAAPLLVLFLRSRWLSRSSEAPPSLGSLALFGAVEWVLWLVIGAAAVMIHFQERWIMLPVIVAILGALLAAARRVGAVRRSWRTAIAMLLLYPIAWIVVQALAWCALLSWSA